MKKAATHHPTQPATHNAAHLQQGVLSGIRVLDFTWKTVGPWAPRLLTHYGAEVIHVERAGGWGEGIGNIKPLFASPLPPSASAGGHRSLAVMAAAPARRGGLPPRPPLGMARQCAACPGGAGWVTLMPQGFPRAGASGRPGKAGGGRFQTAFHRREGFITEATLPTTCRLCTGAPCRAMSKTRSIARSIPAPWRRSNGPLSRH
jgi:hypothetical protein